MTYSFLLVNFNMFGLVERCIGQIQAGVRPGDEYEIVIADNSTDARFSIPEAFVRTNQKIKVVRISQNKGWVDALNQILPLASGEFTVIMHPDVTLGENCLGQLRTFLEQHPQAGFLSPSLSYPDGTPNAIRLRFPKLSV
jgi:GT2 family glycosyltransferase